MGLNRTSDSLSKCDPSLYSNIYDVRKRSDIKQNPVSTNSSIHKDTIDLSRDKMKEEALARLRQTNQIVIPQNSFMRVGKYLFQAIALPPYLLLYGLPKWILVEALPAIFNLCMVMWKKIQENTGKQIEKGTHKVQQMLLTMQKMSLVLIQPIIRLALEFRYKIQRLFNQGLQFFSRFAESLNLPFKKIASGFERLQKRISQAKEKFSLKAQQLSDRFQEGIQWIKQTPQNILAWGQAQFQRLKELAAAKGSPLAKRIHTSQQLAERAANWISKRCGQGMSAFRRGFEPLAAFCRKQLAPRWEAFKKAFSSKWKQTCDFFGQKQRKSLAFLEEKQKKLKDLTHHHLIDKLLSQRWLPGKLQRWMKSFLATPIAQMIIKRGFQGYAFIAANCLKGSAALLKGLSKGAKIIAKARDSLCRFGRIFNQLASSGIEKVYWGGRKVSKLALYYCFLYLLMAAILSVWGLRSLGTLTSFLSMRFISLIKKPHSLKEMGKS